MKNEKEIKKEMEEIKPKRKYTRRKKEVISIEPTEEEYVKYCGQNGFGFLSSFKTLDKNGLTFNVYAALFGLPYLVYRKLYLTAIAYILVSLIMPTSFISGLALVLILGFGTNLAYYKKAEYCIKEIKKREDLNSEMKEEAIRQMGGTDIMGATVIIAISMFFITLLTIAVMGSFSYNGFGGLIY